MAETLGNEKAVGRDTGRFDDESPASLVLGMWETKFQLEFLKVPLDAPMHLGDKHQLLKCNLIGGRKRESILSTLTDLWAIRLVATPSATSDPK